MKKLIILFTIIFINITCLSACIFKTNNNEIVDKNVATYKESEDMKLYIDDKEIDVTWYDNDSVKELKEDAKANDIIVEMNMYGGNEQFGSLGKTYQSQDTRITTESGDIVLYNSDNIVVFYGSNTWEYTKLGKMNLNQEELTELLGNKDITLKLTY